MSSLKKILVPTDFSADAEEATRLAADVAQRYDAELTLVHVHETPAYELPDGHVENMPSQLDRVFADLDQRLGDLAERARAAGAPRVETRILQGQVVRELVGFAAGFDLVVMGTHGRTGLSRLLLGSVAERVVQLAACPVMVSRSKNPG